MVNFQRQPCPPHQEVQECQCKGDQYLGRAENSVYPACRGANEPCGTTGEAIVRFLITITLCLLNKLLDGKPYLLTGLPLPLSFAEFVFNHFHTLQFSSGKTCSQLLSPLCRDGYECHDRGEAQPCRRGSPRTCPG